MNLQRLVEKPWRRWLLAALFFLCFAFAGGAVFLLFLLVPIEHWLAGREWRQEAIDEVAGSLVYGWFVIAMLATFLYYRFMLARKFRPWPALGLLGFVFLAACGAFAVFLNTGTSVIAARRSGAEAVTRNLTFGSYPDLAQLKFLKEQGYDGVITLLHPLVPFEKVLLDEEEENGREAGIEILSFPMLPWIAENKAALDGVRKLIQGNKRYYVHCYLGQHRANLVRNLATGGKGVDEDTVRALFRGGLERGTLLSYDQRRIVVGPFPTDEEWFATVLRLGVREVVVTLDPKKPQNQSWIEKTQKIARDYDFQLTSIPLDSSSPDPGAVSRIANYVKGVDHKVYVLGMRGGNWVWALDAAMGGGGAVPRPVNREAFERGKLHQLGKKYLLGPYPTEDEIGLLRQAGVREVVSLLDDAKPGNLKWIQKEEQWTKMYGFKHTHFPVASEGNARARLQVVADYVKSQPGPFYIHGFRTDERVEGIHDLLQQ